MISLVKQYTVFLPNKPGALHSFIEIFAKEGINIIGISSEIHDDSGIVRICVETNEKISYLLTRNGFTTLETTMLSVILPDKPGQLVKITKLLAENGINITGIYGTASSVPSRLLLNVSDLEKTIELFKENFPELNIKN
jgi:hypothetical protein